VTALDPSGLTWALALLPAGLAAAIGMSAGQIVRRMRPKPATWAVTLTAVAAALCSTYALATVAAVAVGRLDDVADVGGWAPDALSGPATAPTAVALPTAVGVGAAVLCAVAMLARATAALARVERESRRPTSQRLYVIPSRTADAYAVGGITGGRIVVTAGMLDELAPDEFEILLEHERAHLRLRHHLFKTAVRVAACLNPLLRPAVTAVDQAAERWADECAAEKAGDRRLVAKALARAALAARRDSATAPAESHFGTSAVMMRLDALLNPPAPPSRGRLALAVTATVVALSVGSSAAASLHTERVFEKAQATYSATHQSRP
jgi:Zn-dependent protease with chaperone function